MLRPTRGSSIQYREKNTFIPLVPTKGLYVKGNIKKDSINTNRIYKDVAINDNETIIQPPYIDKSYEKHEQ